METIKSEDLARLEQEGFVILEGLLERERADRLGAQLEPWFASTPTCEGDFYGWRTKRVGGLLDKAPLVQELALEPRILSLAQAMLCAHADCLQLNLTQAARILPGEDEQAPHRDEEMWPAEKGGHEWLLNVMWAVDDFTEENGATRLWPRSHRRPLDRRAAGEEASVAAVMPAGSALVFLGSLTHCAGANTSARARTGVIVSYCLGWLKQYENQFLAYPPEVARAFAPPLQRLIGYQMHRPNLGGVDGQDPILALNAPGVVRPHKDALPSAIAQELASLRAERLARRRG